MIFDHLRLAACAALWIFATVGCDESTIATAADDSPAQPANVTANLEANLPSVHLSPAFPRLRFDRPVFMTHAGDGTTRVFVVEQTGRILTFENTTTVDTTEVFLDIQSKVRMRHNEEGLLSLVFHPKYRQNGQFFTYYTLSDPKRNRISRWTVSKENPNRADPASEQVILEVEQKYGNHNGSTLLFGPDGFLYASFGDGGWAGDPDLNGQNLNTLLATVIRIDVDHPGGGGGGGSGGGGDGDRPYSIPKDNPFVNRSGARPEIWAYGLRNVWRMSFDPETGDLWAGDVGQDAWEEINLIVKGGNYGWNLREGTHPFPDGIRRLRDYTPADPLIGPVIDYSHREGISVTGGYVYRGRQSPKLQGAYIYADYGTRTIRGIRYENGKVTAHRKMLSGSESAFITSFGEDAKRELYVCTFDQMDGRKGRIFRVVED